MSDLTAPSFEAPATKRPAGRRALTVLAAALAGLAWWAILDPLAGIDLTADMNGEEGTVGPVAVVVASLFIGLLGWALLAVLEKSLRRSRKRPGRIWAIIAVVVMGLSLNGPLTSAVGTASTLALMSMHLVVGVLLTGGLARTARTARPAATAA